jgi:hypothetical protein
MTEELMAIACEKGTDTSASFFGVSLAWQVGRPGFSVMI